MKFCEWATCGNWAQWRATYPDKTIRLLCAAHKEKLGKETKEPILFSFVGAVPDGVKHTQP